MSEPAGRAVADGEEASSIHLATWLIENGYAEERPGYGHVDGLTLADALREQFDIAAKV